MQNLSFEPKRILALVDFSELSALALKYAAVGANQYGAELLILHAERFEVPPYVLADEYDRVLSELRQRRKEAETFLVNHVREVLGSASEFLTLRFLIVEAHPVDAILSVAENESVDLIVMGTHGRSGWQRFTLGSVTEKVVREAQVPVFVVRQKEREFIDVSNPQAAPKLERILCPVNFTPVAQKAFRYAVDIATRFNAHLTALYIAERDNEEVEKAKEQLCQWLPTDLENLCSIEPVVRKGQAAEQIIAFAREGNYDLLVFGAEHRPFLQSIIFGTTTELLLRHAPIPKLVVPYRAV